MNTRKENYRDLIKSLQVVKNDHVKKQEFTIAAMLRDIHRILIDLSVVDENDIKNDPKFHDFSEMTRIFSKLLMQYNAKNPQLEDF